MDSAPEVGNTGRRYATMLVDGQATWQMSYDHGDLQTSRISYITMQEQVIDPQLNNVNIPSKIQPDSSRQANRQLPSKDVSNETFGDAYVSFILYCNPTVSAETDASELRKAFRSPPKSDGKSFDTFNLFELIRKLELKEIKTWAQLAIDLGVEPPLAEKGQSAQKVQQYAVRLKASSISYPFSCCRSLLIAV